MTDKMMEALAEELAAIDADANLARAEESDTWVVDWFMEQLLMLDAAKAAIAANVHRLNDQIERRRKALEYRWGEKFESEVRKQLTGKSKSIQTLFGRAGYRTVGGKPQIVIEDEEVAIDAASVSCPDAVKILYRLGKTEVLKYTQETGEELPGTRLETPEAQEKFYATPEAKALDVEPVPELEE